MTGPSYIKPIHVIDLQTVTSRSNGRNIRLASCRVNGEPTVAIVRAAYVSSGVFSFEPLFVWPTNHMTVEVNGRRFHRRRGSRGPKRPPKGASGTASTGPTPD
jgi:hypothetical protein